MAYTPYAPTAHSLCIRHDYALGTLPGSGRRKRFITLVERKAMRDHLVKWKLLAGCPQEFNGGL